MISYAAYGVGCEVECQGDARRRKRRHRRARENQGYRSAATAYSEGPQYWRASHGQMTNSDTSGT